MEDDQKPTSAGNESQSTENELQPATNDSSSAKPSAPIKASEKPEEVDDDSETQKGEEQAVVEGVAAIGTVAVWFHKLKQFFKTLWTNKKYRYSTLAGFVVLIAILFLIPFTRYGVLNTVGVRTSANVTVVDEETDLPLKNVTVLIQNKEEITDENGVASFSSLRLGGTELTIRKNGYAEYFENVTLGFGDNRLEPTEIVAIGNRFSFRVSDWLSKQPVEKAEATFGENSAFSDKEGLIILTVPPSEDLEIDVTLGGEDYVEQTATISTTSNEEYAAELVPDRPNYFISKRSGRYDLYKVNLDGSDEQLLLEGTGSESDNLRLSVHENGQQAALASTRSGKRNDGGFLLSTLNLVNLEDGSLKSIAESERVELVGWIDDSLIFIKIAAGTSGANPERHRLISYNTNTGVETQLAASNFFNDVLIAQNQIYYSPSEVYKDNPQPYLFRINADGSDKRTLFSQETWSIFRTDFDVLLFQAKSKWYQLGVGSTEAVETGGPPSSRVSRLYEGSPDGKQAAWVDQRDGKGVLLIYSTETQSDEIIQSRAGLNYPVRWLDDSRLIFRVVTSEETADYAISLDGGEPIKVSDVSDVKGVDRWYYY